MRYIVPGYVHRKGVHCGSSAMRNVLAFYGISLSEPLCFGLGSGAGFLYVREMPVSPGTAFHGRIMEMERELCDVLALPFPERTEPDAEAGWRNARDAMLSGHPVLINTDLAFLDYFATKTHFSGHRIVLCGFDDGSGDAIVSDSERDVVQEVPVESLARSRASAIPPYPMENRWCVLAPPAPPRSAAEAVPIALKKNADGMLAPPEGGAEGVAGIRAVARELPRWPEMTEHWVFAARFGYQVIEKRGTGGGFFRRLYAEYLSQASAFHPGIARAGLPGKLIAVADGWTGIAARLKEISETKDRTRFAAAAELFRRQADAEEAFWNEAGRLASSLGS